MDNIRTLFNKINFLSAQMREEIFANATISTVTNSPLTFKFVFNDLISWSLLEALVNEIKKFSNHFTVIVEFKRITNTHNLSDGLNKFFNQKTKKNKLIQCAVRNHDIVISVDDPADQELIKGFAVELLEYFRQHHIDFNQVVIDERKIAQTKHLTEMHFTPRAKNHIQKGYIFCIKEPKNPKMPFTFYVHDGQQAAVLKYFLKNKVDSEKSLIEKLALNDWIEYIADFRPDQYDARHQVVGFVNYIKKIECPTEFKHLDPSPKPRIELLAHTNMSVQDGLNDPREILKRVCEFNAPGIAFADRSNVHNYSEIAELSEKICPDKKIIYGVEAAIIDRNKHIVINANDSSLDKMNYVCFDIETTGLNARYDEIIEFGGVKVINGQVVDHFQTFIKPKKSIPTFITNLTKIRNEDVANAPTIKVALEKIVEWIGDLILIAHNGINFDIKFLNQKLLENNLPILHNPLIDTLELSRCLNVGLKGHNLGSVCRNYKIIYDEHVAHRADYDAEILNNAWSFMHRQLTELKMKQINELNQLKCPNYYNSQFPLFCQIYTKNQAGLKDLYHLISISYTEQFFREPTIFIDQINAVRKNFVIASSPFWGDVWENALNGTEDELIRVMQFYDYIFISPIASINYLFETNACTPEIAKNTILRIIDVAKKINKPVAAVSGFYYLNRTSQDAHRVFIMSKLPGGRAHRFFNYGATNDHPPLLYYRNTQEMLDELNFIQDQKVLNDIVIDQTYAFMNEFEKIKINKKGLFVPNVSGAKENLEQEVYQRAKAIYGDQLDPIIAQRIKNELEIIINKGYECIYWISHLLVKKSNSEGYIVGSRGSVGSSVVAYLSGISEINPLAPHYICPKCQHHEFSDLASDGFDLPDRSCPHCQTAMNKNGHNIPFETFLGTPGAEKVPDIDLNFSGEYQARAHKFIVDMFGKENTYRAGTISTVADKKAYGFVKNYFELVRPGYEPSDAEIELLAQQLVGVKITTGQHPGGMIIVPKEYSILDFCPYNFPPQESGNSTDGSHAGWYATHFDFHKIHDNLLKFDILGHDFPTMAKMFETSSKVELKQVNFSDPAVIELFKSLKSLKISSDALNGETLGTYGLPECSTDFTLKMIKDAKPESFDDLIRISGLSHGTDVWSGNAHELLANDPTLKLKDVICCREDIMLYLIARNVQPAIAFKISEKVRKGQGKDVINEYGELLKEKGIPQWYLDSCKKIKYLFPKAHAAAYMTASYICGWYKIYYPIHFYAGILTILNNSSQDYFDLANIQLGAENIKTKLNEYRARGKEKLEKKEKDAIDVYRICLEMYARGFEIANVSLERSLADQFKVDGNTLIPPFTVINGLGAEVANSIINEREIGPFTSKKNLSDRTKVNKKILKLLTDLNVLIGLDEDEQLSLF